MQTFSSEDLQHRSAEVQRSALAEPTFITLHGHPRLVMMSLDEFDRLRGRRHKVLNAVALSDGVLQDLRGLADQEPPDGTDPVILGGLLGDEAVPGVLPQR